LGERLVYRPKVPYGLLKDLKFERCSNILRKDESKEGG